MAASAKPWLSDHFISQELTQLVEKRVLRKPRIRFGPYVMALAYMYEVGAVLGAARPDRAEDLIRLCVVDLEDKRRNLFLGQAEFHRSLLHKSGAPTPSYMDLVFELFFKSVPADRRLEFILATADEEQAQDDVVGHLRMVFTWGIAFGCMFPAEVETLWNAVHIKGESGEVSSVRALGLRRGPREDLPFSEFQQMLLNEAAVFVGHHYPGQMEGLGLGESP